jgi:dTDP-glucose 4,6-dehydratase
MTRQVLMCGLLKPERTCRPRASRLHEPPRFGRVTSVDASWEERRVVVTGGAGFVGSWLCGRLLDLGAQAVCIDNHATGSPDNLAHLAGHPRLTVVKHDLCAGLPIPGPVDLVLHLASPASPLHYRRLPIETLRVSSVGTMHALDFAVTHGARFLLASTSEVYGDPLVHPQSEAYWGNVNPVGERSVYDEGKRFAEAVTMAYRRALGADTAIARIFNTYGPRMRRDDGRAIPAFVSQAIAGRPLTVAGDGSQTRSLCYVEDTVEGILALAASGHPGPVNIGSDEELTILELANRVRDLAGSTSTVELVELPADDPKVRRPDTKLAAEILGWQPRIRLEEGLTRTLEWFADQDARLTGSSAAAVTP